MDDDFIFLSSSEGNEHLESKYKDKIGDDVMAKVYVNYLKFESLRDNEDSVIGTKITQVVECCPGGSIPDMLKTTALSD